MKILVLNSGSSTIKYKVFAFNGHELEIANGMVDRIGQKDANLVCDCCFPNTSGCAARRLGEDGRLVIPDHSTALDMICTVLTDERCGVLTDLTELLGIGHRVVHGGETFSESVVIDENVIADIEKCCRLAPLHNPPALAGIRACQSVFPGVPQVAVFDTAFHRTIPEKAYRYAVPSELYEKYGIRKYGFHGTSHRHASRTAARLLGKPIEDTRIVSCHLGNGSSIAAVRGGKSIDTTMGLTPLGGVMMGTRPGDIDPYIPLFMIKELHMTADEVDRKLNKESGFEGICHHKDVREVKRLMQEGDRDCTLAVEMFAYRTARFIGGSVMALNGVDAIVFTGGIGQNDPDIRARILANATHLGVQLDPRRNEQNELRVSLDDSKVAIFVVPANEELVIARDTESLLQDYRKKRRPAAVPAGATADNGVTA